MDESFDHPSGNNNATGLSVEGSRVLQIQTGATGSKTATAAGYADAGNAHILALRPAGAPLVISKPSGTVSGDVMIAAIGFTGSGLPVTPPSGWTLVRRVDNPNTNSNSLAVYHRTAGTSEPTSYGWAVANAASIVGGIQSFSGVDTASPIEGESGQATPSSSTHDTPSITTASADTMLVTAHTLSSASAWTPEAGLTEGFDQKSSQLFSPSGQSIMGGHQPQATAGASGAKRATSGDFWYVDVGNTHILALRRLVPNAPPTVNMTSPANGATFNAPANITLSATAADSDGTIQKVEFFHGGNNLIATVTTPPYSIAWTGVPQGAYVLTAVATDNRNAVTTSASVNVTVEAPVAAIYFIEVDHLNTPRLVASQSGQTVWRWDQQEPFGVSVPDENPSGLGAFDLPLRLPGQYFDKETNLHYNYFRDYDPSLGRYVESDPIGLRGGLNTYSYVRNNPIARIDPLGLDEYQGTLGVGGSFGFGTGSGFGRFYGWGVSGGIGFSECEIRFFGQIAGSKGKGYGAYAGAGVQAGGGYSEGPPQEGVQRSFQAEGMGGAGPSLGGQLQVSESGVSATGGAGRFGAGFGLAVTASDAYTLTKTLRSLPNPFGGDQCSCK